MKKFRFQLAVGLAAAALIGLPMLSWAQDVEQMARDLYQSEVTPEAAMTALIESGIAPGRATRAMTQTWADCDATYEAVATAITLKPEKARSVVSAAVSVRACGCGSDEMWNRSRLEGRLRPPSAFFVIEIQDLCGCATAAMEAAATVLPEQADSFLASAIVTMQDEGTIVDSVGRRGSRDWAAGMEAMQSARFVRAAEVCKGDTNLDDSFQPGDEWALANQAGVPDRSCDSGDLLLSEFAIARQGIAFVRIHNASDNTVDLQAEQLVLNVYYESVPDGGNSIPLHGELEPGQSLLVSSDGFATVKADASVVDPGLSIIGGDTLALVRQPSPPNCDCAEPLAGAAADAVQPEIDSLRTTMSGSTSLSCHVEVMTLLDEIGPAAAFFAQSPGTPTREPVPKPPNVDPIASPN